MYTYRYSLTRPDYVGLSVGIWFSKWNVVTCQFWLSQLTYSIALLFCWKKKHDTKETRKKIRQKGMGRIKMKGGVRGNKCSYIFEVLTAALLKT